MMAAFLDKTNTALDFERILSLLQHALASNYRAYFAIDGPDECTHSERETLVQHLRKLQEASVLLLYISLRLERNNTFNLNLDQFTSAKTTSIPDHNLNIDVFIRAELERCIESKKLVIGQPEPHTRNTGYSPTRISRNVLLGSPPNQIFVHHGTGFYHSSGSGRSS